MQNDDNAARMPKVADGTEMTAGPRNLLFSVSAPIDSLLRQAGEYANTLPDDAQQADAIFAHIAAMPLNMIGAGMMHRAAVDGNTLPTIEEIRAELDRHISYALDQAVPFLHEQMSGAIARGEHLPPEVRQQPGEAVN